MSSHLDSESTLFSIFGGIWAWCNWIIEPWTFFKLTQLFMKDGDVQQHNEIKHVMLSYLSNATNSACGWHIVHQGWKRDYLGIRSVPKKMNQNGNRFPSTSRLGYITGCILSIVKPRRTMKYLRSCCFVMFQAEQFTMHQVELTYKGLDTQSY